MCRRVLQKRGLGLSSCLPRCAVVGMVGGRYSVFVFFVSCCNTIRNIWSSSIHVSFLVETVSATNRRQPQSWCQTCCSVIKHTENICQTRPQDLPHPGFSRSHSQTSSLQHGSSANSLLSAANLGLFSKSAASGSRWLPLSKSSCLGSILRARLTELPSGCTRPAQNPAACTYSCPQHLALSGYKSPCSKNEAVRVHSATSPALPMNAAISHGCPPGACAVSWQTICCLITLSLACA